MSTKITDEQKDKLHATVAGAATAGAKQAAEAAKTASGWKKWVLWIAAGIGYALAGLAALAQTSCTQAQVQEAGHVLHGIYHADTGTTCIFEQAQEGK